MFLFQGVLKNKEAKKERGEVRKEQKLMIPKKKRAWSFADLPPEQQKNLRDFSELPRDCWIIIFKVDAFFYVCVCACMFFFKKKIQPLSSAGLVTL